MITLYLTEHEASCLALAALYSRSKTYPRPALESAREKLRYALDRPYDHTKERWGFDETGERYVSLEC